MNILILTASTGGGHKSAASALKNTIEKTDPATRVEIHDAIKYCGRLYNKFICGGYVMLATKTPRLYGRLYDLSDKESILNDICNHFNTHEGKKLISLFNQFKPDVVISCHAFITTMLAGLKRKKLIDFPAISLITDFTPHKTYFFPEIEAYVTPCDNITEEIVTENGIERDRLYPLGIPIAEKFYKPSDKNKIAKDLGFSPDKQTVLLMAGSFGVTEVLKIFESFCSRGVDCQCIIVTGKNKKLYGALTNFYTAPGFPAKA